MSFGPRRDGVAGVPTYHRPISSQSYRNQQQHPTSLSSTQPIHFTTDGRGHFASVDGGVSSSSSSSMTRLSQTAPQQFQAGQRAIRGNSAGGRQQTEIHNREAQPSGRTGVVSDRGVPAHLGSPTGVAAVPPWQHYRGPVAAVHRGSGGGGTSNGPATANGNVGQRVAPQGSVRPQSSFGPIRANQGQSYNILNGQPYGPGGGLGQPVTSSRNGWGFDDSRSFSAGSGGVVGGIGGGGLQGVRPPVVVDHANGSRIYHQTIDADSLLPSSRQSGRGPASQRSLSVDRGSARRSGSYGQHQQPSYQHQNQHQHDQQPPSERFNSTQPFGSDSQRNPFTVSSSSSSSSPFSLSSTQPFSTRPATSSSFGSTVGSLTGSFGSPLTSHAPTARPDTASSDDGASFLEVGVAEDPNPRFRPTMEDAHVVKVGDWEDEPQSHRGSTAGKGLAGTTRRAQSHDLSASRSRSHSQPRGAKGHAAKNGYFAVYDGHGGREAVDYIERNLHRQLARQLKTGQNPQQALQAAFLETDAQMQATRQYQDCGSTVVSALLRPSESRAGQRDLHISNVGDARAVLAVSGPPHSGQLLSAVRLSRDHTPNDPSEADRVRRAGGAVFRGRVDGQLAVSRAIGDHSLKRSGVSAQPHQLHMPLTKDHKFVVLACDGLWDVMTDTYGTHKTTTHHTNTTPQTNLTDNHSR